VAGLGGYLARCFLAWLGVCLILDDLEAVVPEEGFDDEPPVLIDPGPRAIEDSPKLLAIAVVAMLLLFRLALNAWTRAGTVRSGAFRSGAGCISKSGGLTHPCFTRKALIRLRKKAVTLMTITKGTQHRQTDRTMIMIVKFGDRAGSIMAARSAGKAGELAKNALIADPAVFHVRRKMGGGGETSFTVSRLGCRHSAATRFTIRCECEVIVLRCGGSVVLEVDRHQFDRHVLSPHDVGVLGRHAGSLVPPVSRAETAYEATC
jgi:hypothetical protein